MAIHVLPRHRAFGLLLASVVGGACLCGREIHGFEEDTLDAGHDGGAALDAGDAGPDAGDAGIDAGIDAGLDAGADGGADAGHESALDAGGCIRGVASNLNSSVTYPAPGPYLPLISADLNNDGLLDLVAPYDSSSGFDVFLALPDGGLTAAINYPGNTSPVVAVADVNQDGWPDLVVGDALALDIDLYFNTGTGDLIRKSSIPTTYGYATAIGVGDFNADGFPDIVVSEFLSFAEGTTAEIFFGGRGGSFDAPVTLTELQGTFPFVNEQIIVADLNDDGLPDIVASYAPDQLHQHEVAVLFNKSDGGFQMATYGVYGDIALLTPASGPPDILVVHYGGFGPSYLQVLRNMAGAFSLGELYSVDAGNAGLWYTVGDFNGDCIPDVVLTEPGACGSAGAAINVFYGDGQGGFDTPEPVTPAGDGPFYAAPIGPVESPRALAVFDFCNGLEVYGDATRH